jgi:hypothetical protein
MSLRSKLIALLLGIISSYAAPMTWPSVASAESCPNEEVRAEQGSERLPDCRAFELVTPEIKNDNSAIGGSANSNPYGFPDGNHVYYRSLLPLPGAQDGELASVLSTRTASGWVNTVLAPPAGGGEPNGVFHQGSCGSCPGQAAFTADFSAAFVAAAFANDPLDQDGVVDAYRMDLSSGAWSLVALPDTGPMMASFNGSQPGTFVAGVSEDGSHVFFQTLDQLPVAPGTNSELHPSDMLYDRTGGHTYMVGVLPNGTISQTCKVELGDGTRDAGLSGYGFLTYRAISPDGTNVVFTVRGVEESCGPDEGVYLREHNATNKATTVQLGGDRYLGRTSDGSKVFTTTIGFEGINEYDVASGATTTISTDGQFLASSVDGSRVYYLIEEGRAGAGLYLWDKGTSTLIPKAGEGFASFVNRGGNRLATSEDYAVTTPDGSKLLFVDRASLTGYNSFGPACTDTGGPGLCAEAYVYDATTGSVTCVSCSPTGAPALGNAHLMSQEQKNTLLPDYSEGEISPDGSRVFFETPDALVPQDTNGLPDVYEWENGRVYLISSGQGTSGSHFSGASSNGDDVFITTTDRLAPQDIENSVEVYDARVGGGFPYRPFTTGCNSGQCQGPQTPAPVFGAPASATFVGLGNPGAREPNPLPVKPKPLTSAQKLAKALKACRTKHNKRERLACEKQARKRYGHRSRSARRPKS